MVMEVYTGSRPGRPTLLLLLCAGVLALVLGLAWGQVRLVRALGPELRVAGTPLLVRLPREWRVDPENSSRFILPIRHEGWRRSALGFERRVQLYYETLPRFLPTDQLLERFDLTGPRGLLGLRATRIGPYPAVEARRVDTVRWRRYAIRREVVTRLASLPRGEVIVVIYEPLDTFRPADAEILDEICATLRVDDEALTRSRGELLAAAGLELELPPDWTVAGARLPRVAGVHVGGVDDGVPAWSIDILRTWLAEGRAPSDLLLDLAASEWTDPDGQAEVRAEPRSDGVAVARIRHPGFGRADEPMPSAWIVAESADRAALLLVHAGPRQAAAADRAAEKLAGELRLASIALLSNLAAATEGAQRLVERLATHGPVPRWGREAVDVTYLGRIGATEFELQSRRAADARDPQRGYQGVDVLRRDDVRGRALRLTTQWRVDGRAGAYSYTTEVPAESGILAVTEERAAADAPVRRTRALERSVRPRVLEFRPGPRFVPPPLESLVVGWVARREVPTALLEASSLLGRSTHSVLAVSLDADGAYPRALVLQDYHPIGMVQAFDDDRAVVEHEMTPRYEFRRASGNSAAGRGRPRP